jgi:hypothetical protein
MGLPMPDNIKRLMEEGALDTDAINRLEQSVQDKINSWPKKDIDVLIKRHAEISPDKPWEPDRDGSVF